MTDLDRIEKQISINATAQRVWDLVSRPGWFINDGAVIEHQLERQGDVTVVRDPVHGDFPYATVRLDPPRYASFRWLSSEATDPLAHPSTLVEFRIEDAEDGVVLHVCESGFASMPGTELERRARLEGNTTGWTVELEAARAYLDCESVHRSVFINARPEDVWPLVTTPDHFTAWYAFDGAQIDARPGGRMRLTWAEHGSFEGVVVMVNEPTCFAYRIAITPDTTPVAENSTLVTITLKASGAGTLVTATQTGFSQLAPEFGSAIDNAAADALGWEGGFAMLARYASDRQIER